MSNSPESKADPLQGAFAILSGEDATERACKAIPDAQCTSVPRNYVLNVFNGACTKLAEQLVSPTLVLPWLVAAMGAPAAVAGWFVPAKQAGSLLPQMAVAARIRGLARRKWAWVGAGATQAMCLLLMAVAVLILPSAPAAWVMLGLFAVFSVASGVGSVAFQDVTGKTVSKGIRGRMLANRATIGGALTLAAAAAIKVFIADDADVSIYAVLIAAAAVLWAVAAGAFALVDETPGASEGGRDLIGEVRAGLHFVREDPGFARFLLVRIAFVVGVELAPPYFALLAQDSLGGGMAALGVLIFAVGIANVLSSTIWGGLADRSSRRVCIVAGLVGGAAAFAAIAAALYVPEDLRIWAFGGVFVLVGIAEAGVRLGRKTYLVDTAPGDERPLYTALSNTLAGAAAIIAGTLGFFGAAFGMTWLVLVLGGIALVGALLAVTLPEADD